MNRLLLCVLCLMSFACSSATVYRHDAPDLEATILGGNATHIYVESDDGRIVRIPRKNITEVDHPGNIEAIIGGILGVTGGSLIVLANTSNQSEARAIFSAIGAIYAIPGIILMADGLINWNRSTDAFNDKRTELPLRRPPPILRAEAPVALALPATLEYAIPVTLPGMATPTPK